MNQEPVIDFAQIAELTSTEFVEFIKGKMENHLNRYELLTVKITRTDEELENDSEIIDVEIVTKGAYYRFYCDRDKNRFNYEVVGHSVLERYHALLNGDDNGTPPGIWNFSS